MVDHHVALGLVAVPKDHRDTVGGAEADGAADSLGAGGRLGLKAGVEPWMDARRSKGNRNWIRTV